MNITEILDIKDELSTYRINELKNILNVKMGNNKKIQHIRSHEVDLLQLCDLLIDQYHIMQTIKRKNLFLK